MRLPMRLTSTAWPTWHTVRSKATAAMASGIVSKACADFSMNSCRIAGPRSHASSALNAATPAAHTIDNASDCQCGCR